MSWNEPASIAEAFLMRDLIMISGRNIAQEPALLLLASDHRARAYGADLFTYPEPKAGLLIAQERVHSSTRVKLSVNEMRQRQGPTSCSSSGAPLAAPYSSAADFPEDGNIVRPRVLSAPVRSAKGTNRGSQGGYLAVSNVVKNCSPHTATSDGGFARYDALRKHSNCPVKELGASVSSVLDAKESLGLKYSDAITGPAICARLLFYPLRWFHILSLRLLTTSSRLRWAENTRCRTFGVRISSATAQRETA
jgi:hypothetical protein